MTRPEISGISPFFIVHDIAAALSFYRDRLGFDITFQGPADDVFFGIVCRGGAMIMLKNVGVDPLPNYKREPGARWDAYLNVLDPDALAAEFSSRNIEFSQRFVFRPSSVMSVGRSPRPTTRSRRRAKTHAPERTR